MKMKWAYGVTTVPQRLEDGLLERTLKSLAAAGFESPRLFVDGAPSADPFRCFGLHVTTRFPRIRVVGNWLLSLGELYIRNPNVDRFAMFQDDFVTYRNLRYYLERVAYPDKGYCNLYTFPVNQLSAPAESGWYKPAANCKGLGAVAMVFSREAVRTILGHEFMIRKVADESQGWRKIDGALWETLTKSGFAEYVHSPSLVQHLGGKSTIGNHNQAQAVSFLGEDYDAMALLTDQSIDYRAIAQTTMRERHSSRQNGRRQSIQILRARVLQAREAVRDQMGNAGYSTEDFGYANDFVNEFGSHPSPCTIAVSFKTYLEGDALVQKWLAHEVEYQEALGKKIK